MRAIVKDLLLKLSPATRSSLIISSFFVGLFLLGTLWVGREALRISRQRDLNRATNAASAEGEMVWIAGGTFTMGGVP